MKAASGAEHIGLVLGPRPRQTGESSYRVPTAGNAAYQARIAVTRDRHAWAEIVIPTNYDRRIEALMAGKTLRKAKTLSKPTNPVKTDLHPKTEGLKPGKVKDRSKDHFLVPANTKGTPKIDSGLVPPNTYVRIVKKTGRVQCLVTIMPGSRSLPEGTFVAWDVCGRCGSYFSLCRCAQGITAPRSVEYIYDADTAYAKGEEWDYRHPNYKGSLTAKQREARASRNERRYVDRPIAKRVPAMDEPKPESTGKGKSLKKAKPKSLKKVRSSDEVMVDGKVDIGKMNDAATESSQRTMGALTRMLADSEKKKAPTAPPARKGILSKVVRPDGTVNQKPLKKALKKRPR